MARRKQEIQLQIEIETQEEWEEMLCKEGVTVVDVYQDWSGPCKAMVSSFRKFKNDLGDDLLHFAVAKSDTVDALEKYRGRCEPCFLFFAAGVLVHVVRGAYLPELQKAVTAELKAEHRVIDGNDERKEIRDPFLSIMDGREEVREDDGEDEANESEELNKGVSVAIIKPDLVAAGKVDEVIQTMKEHGIEILQREEKQLTEEQVREFYTHLSQEDFFESLVQFMSSGPSVILVITKGETGDSIIEEWRELLGPKLVEEAKEKAPSSLRAQFGDHSFLNGLHGSDSAEQSVRELAFFYPNYHLPQVDSTDASPPFPSSKQPQNETQIQRTLALIRPDALAQRKDEILAKIGEAGFTIAMSKEIRLSREQAEAFYSEHMEQPYFEELTQRMSNGPLLALALAREDAVQGWRDALGPSELETAKTEAPESLRSQFAMEGVPINTLHGSDSAATAQKEIEFFFPVQQTVAMIKPDAYESKEVIMARVKEAGFHIASQKETDITKEFASQFYGDHKDKDYFNDLTDHMTSGTTLFMVLSREDAVDRWRSIIGPTDPSEAKEKAPDTIRAQFGQDIKANAVHGSSTSEHAKQQISLIFGEDVHIDPAAAVTEDSANEVASDGVTGTEAPVTEDTANEVAADGVTESEAPVTEDSANEVAADGVTESGGDVAAETATHPDDKSAPAE